MVAQYIMPFNSLNIVRNEVKWCFTPHCVSIFGGSSKGGSGRPSEARSSPPPPASAELAGGLTETLDPTEKTIYRVQMFRASGKRSFWSDVMYDLQTDEKIATVYMAPAGF